ncbi:hypothetical protein C2G38_2072997, partial [Gigaspora rosea]
MKTLNFLYDKTVLFYYNIFKTFFTTVEKVFQDCKKKKKLPTIYYLATLNKDVDLRHLPTAYSTAHPPCTELCDSCRRLLVNNNSMVFACGHSYHIDCYCGKCT